VDRTPHHGFSGFSPTKYKYVSITTGLHMAGIITKKALAGGHVGPTGSGFYWSGEKPWLQLRSFLSEKMASKAKG
jgi:hypothetical protein